MRRLHCSKRASQSGAGPVLKVVLQWFTMVLVLQWCFSGMTVVLRWRSNLRCPPGSTKGHSYSPRSRHLCPRCACFGASGLAGPIWFWTNGKTSFLENRTMVWGHFEIAFSKSLTLQSHFIVFVLDCLISYRCVGTLPLYRCFARCLHTSWSL
jgi:hypothetical protein